MTAAVCLLIAGVHGAGDVIATVGCCGWHALSAAAGFLAVAEELVIAVLDCCSGVEDAGSIGCC
jgi:hypothetical protein